jgi:tetratricopeptide (TPR) repeat protein
MAIRPEDKLREARSAYVSGDEAAAARNLLSILRAGPLAFDLARAAAILARSIDRNDIAIRILRQSECSDRTTMMILQLRQELGEAVADATGAIAGQTGTLGDLAQHVGGLHAEMRSAEAIALLRERLRVNPEWLAGHSMLAQLCWQSGNGEAATESYREALRSARNIEGLWSAYLSFLINADLRAELNDAIDEALSILPDSQIVQMVAADGMSSLGEAGRTDALLKNLATVSSPEFDATRLRHMIRNGRIDAAIEAGVQAVKAHGHGECWAWLGTAWRLADDPRSDWFHRGDSLVYYSSLNGSALALPDLAKLLRKLHSNKAHPLGQSPRGGTQTQGPLLKRKDSEIRHLRFMLRNAIRDYISRLPAPVEGHPLLSRARRAFRFEGSWSVRLLDEGFHLPHIHSHGWISAAFYVVLPAQDESGDKQAGWLQIGRAPLPEPFPGAAIKDIKPLTGHLALFPSTFWHSTVPFPKGERLTVAFDVVSV